MTLPGGDVLLAKRGSPPLLLLPLLLPLLLSLLLPSPAVSFEVASLLVAFRSRSHATCPVQCTCTVRRAEDVMLEIVNSYMPDQLGRLEPLLEQQVRSSVSLFTAWLGNMMDLVCHLKDREWVNLTDLLQASKLSFMAVRVHCQDDSGVTWDVSAHNAFLNVLQLWGCGVQGAPRDRLLEAPENLWVLSLENSSLAVVHRLDLSKARQLRVLSLTHSNLSSLPQHWSDHQHPHLAFVSLSHNPFRNFSCVLRPSHLVALNLNYNQLTALPACVLDMSEYTSYLSLRHNQVDSLEGLLDDQGNESMAAPAQLSFLDLAHNRVSDLHALRKIQPFKGMDLSHNNIVRVAANTFSLHPALAWLDLSHNQLQSVPDGFLGKQGSMVQLNLSHNLLSDFSSQHGPPTNKMFTLDLRHNQLVYPPYADSDFVPLSTSSITAAHNPYRCDCYVHHFIQSFSQVNKGEKKRWLTYWAFAPLHRAPRPQSYVDSQEMLCSQPEELSGIAVRSLSFHEACPLLRGCPVDCKCELIKGSARHVAVDCSQRENLTELPSVVPVVPDTPLVLYVNQSGLKRLDHRPYLPYVSELHAANSKLNTITYSALLALQNISVLNLRSAQLRSLPSSLQNLSLDCISSVDLSDNPWTCGCHDLWMPDWLARHHAKLFHSQAIRCHWTGKPVRELNSLDLNCGMFQFLPLLIAVSMVTCFVAILISLLRKYKLDFLAFVFQYFRLRPFDAYNHYTPKPFLYDVLLSFSRHDESWVMEKVVDHLENRARPYKLCIPDRDLPLDAEQGERLRWAMDNSCCTLLILTRHLLATEWLSDYFREAHERLYQQPSTKPITKLVVMVDGPLDARTLDLGLLQHMRQHVYLRTEDKNFKAKMDYSLPPANAIRPKSCSARCVVTERPAGFMAAGDLTLPQSPDWNPSATSD